MKVIVELLPGYYRHLSTVPVILEFKPRGTNHSKPIDLDLSFEEGTLRGMAEEADAAHRAPEPTDEAGSGAMESVPPLQPLLVPTTKPDDLSFSHVDSAETSGEEGEEEDGDESGGKNGRLNVCKKSWTAAEDEILADIIAQHGAQRWSSVAQHLPGRMGKQCRERCATHSCTPRRARKRRVRAVVRADPAHSTHAHAHPLRAHAPPPPRAVSVQCPQPATFALASAPCTGGSTTSALK